LILRMRSIPVPSDRTLESTDSRYASQLATCNMPTMHHHGTGRARAA
jgi:hypothetical protein